MLISFSVSNFRSIKEKQTIDLTPASKYSSNKDAKGFSDNLFTTGNKTVPELLKSSAIYGANASGKTNIMFAAVAFRSILFGAVDDSGFEFSGNVKRSRGQFIPYDPFILDRNWQEKPTTFEIDFIANDKSRYLYSFSYDQAKIHSEKLRKYSGKTLEVIYEIYPKESGSESIFSEEFTGKKEKALNIFTNTKNNFFLVLNVNEDGNKFLNPIYDWLLNNFATEIDHENRFVSSLQWCASNKSNKQKTVSLLKDIDVGISDLEISFEEVRFKQDNNHLGLGADKIKKIPVIRFIAKNGKTKFRPDQVSDGTIAIFSISSLIFSILENGGILFFDELDSKLHPEILVKIVKMFHDPRINKGNGQIIFTAHNDILLEKDYGLLRRDQVWFAARSDKTGASEYYSLVEFGDVKARDNIADRYRDYAFGARPILKDF